MELIEKLVMGLEVTKDEIEYELLQICDREHSSCNSECPVYRLNGSAVVNGHKLFTVNRGCDCFKDGREMYKFIKKHIKRQVNNEKTNMGRPC